MLSGRRLDLLDPSPLDVEIEDIAHGLARVARWNGQTEGAHIFSVAQHTLLVDTVARTRWPSLDRVARLDLESAAPLLDRVRRTAGDPHRRRDGVRLSHGVAQDDRGGAGRLSGGLLALALFSASLQVADASEGACDQHR